LEALARELAGSPKASQKFPSHDRTRLRFAADSPLEEAGFAQVCNIRSVDWQTGLSADIDTKGVSGAVANLRRW
jgi:hypothetical protein